MTLARAAKVIESGIERGLHLGAQLYVSQDGRRVADLAFGLAREGVAMTPDTIMLWMSSTKPITALAIVQVWERGKIALDDRVEIRRYRAALVGDPALHLRGGTGQRLHADDHPVRPEDVRAGDLDLRQ